MHLADAFIQSDLHCIQITVFLHLTSSCFPWEIYNSFSYINKIIALTFVKLTGKESCLQVVSWNSSACVSRAHELIKPRVVTGNACKLKTAHFNHVGFIQYSLYLELFKMNI